MSNESRMVHFLVSIVMNVGQVLFMKSVQDGTLQKIERRCRNRRGALVRVLSSVS